jgi:aldose sugar dehydrogenase
MRSVAAAAALVFATSLYAAPTLEDSSLTWSNYLPATRPTGIRFTGINEGFFIEQGGALKRFVNGSVSTVMNFQIATDGFERGLVGLEVDPDFKSNRFVYTYHTAGTSSGAWIENRLIRHTWNGTGLENPVPLATFGSAADGQAKGPIHNGGPLKFGHDGKLYGITGDLNRNGIEQNRSATQSAFTGGIFRLNSDGSIPADNPFVSNSNPDVRRLYSYGVRNSFGLTVDPFYENETRIWDTENGPAEYDEINFVPPGMNSGWNRIMGPDARDPQNAPGDLVMLPGAVYGDPKLSLADSSGIAALAFLHGSSLAGFGYGDAVIFTRTGSNDVFLLRLNGDRDGFALSGSLADGVVDAGDVVPLFGKEFRFFTDIQTGPDGAIYLAGWEANTIYRIAPVPEPHTWALMLVGLALAGGAARCRRT